MGDVDFLKTLILTQPDFPIKGIQFLDWLPILRNPVAFETLISHLIHHITSDTLPRTPSRKIDIVVGLEARGFLIGPIIALRLGAAFIPVRKRGKLPGECVSATYVKEYGADGFEMQAGGIQPDDSVIVIDDLIATGGSAKAAGELVAKLGGIVVEYVFVIELAFLKGRDKLGSPVYSMLQSNE